MKLFTGIFTMTAGMVAVGLLIGHSESYAQSEVYGTMMVVKGDIKVTSAKSGKTDNAKVGFKVYSGDAIASGADSRAKIIMSDKNVINVSPDSKVTIAKYENNPSKDTRNVELKVDYGKVRASVEQNYDGEKNKFNIRTPTAVAGVRGTDFIAGFNPQSRKTSIVTFSGVVAVGTAGPNGQISNPVFVRPGQSTSVGEGQAPEAPKAVPRDQMQNMNQESAADTAQSGTSANEPSAAAPQAGANEPKPEESAPQTAAEPATTAKSDTSAPAADGPKADAPASGPGSSGDGKTATKGPAAGSSAGSSGNSGDAPKSNSRTPAALPSMPSMVDARDLDTSISREIKVAPNLPSVPTTFKPPTLSPVVSPPPNQFIDNAIRNQKSRVRVEICRVGAGC